jgi:hypothetical protein
LLTQAPALEAANLWRGAWAGVILVSLLSTGCNFFFVPYYLLMGEAKHAPKCQLADDKNKERHVKVVILSYAGLETRPEFMRVDREIASLLSQQLQEGFKKNKEKVAIVPTRKVEEFRSNHPDWRSLKPEDIGEHFKADYVIDLSINELRLYEPGSRNTLFRGHAEISLAVLDMKKPGDEPKYREEYSCDFPKTRGPVPVDSNTSAQQFRQAFLTNVARELSWRFTAHPTSDDFRCD